MSAAKLVCPASHCGFDLSLFRASVRMGSSESQDLHCPACGTRVPLRLESFGIFCIDDGHSSRFVAWKTRNSLVGDRPEFVLGRFKVLLSPAPEVIRPEEVAYPAVPVFKETDGKLRVPTLPLRADCMVFLDPEHPVTPGRLEQQTYVVRLRLRGLDEPLDLRLPLLPADPADRATTGPAEARAFRGVNLRMWPKVPYPAWKRFYLSLGAVDDNGRRLFSTNRPVRAFWISDGNAHEIERETANGSARVACTSARPEWVALEFKDEKGTLVGGGLWQVPAASGSYVNRTVNLGADFGTSNTAFAYRIDQRPSLIPNSDPLFLLKSGDEPSSHKHLEMWIPRSGFGPMKDLFASELLFARPVVSMVDEVAFRKLKPIEDYCISQSGVRVEYDERGHVVSGLKWRNGISPPNLGKTGLFTLLQEAYLDFVTFLCLGHIYAGQSEMAPGSLDIRFSYPLVFLPDQVKALSQVWNAIAERMAEATGLSVNVDPNPVDEATAATGMLRPKRDWVRLVVDIGGGTTDIAMLWSVRSQDETATPVYVTSVRFAGTNILQAFQGYDDGKKKSPNCLVPSLSAESLKRRIREAPEIRDAFASDDVLNSSREKLANARIKMFYGYLLEYVSRMVVSPLAYPAGRKFRDAEGGIRQVPSNLQVEILLLGNGWAFGDLVDMSGVAEMVEAIVGRRTEAIADGLERAEPATIKVSVRRPEGVEHPKAAVAMGLLNLEGAGGSGRRIVTRRILGVTTKIGDVTVPWYEEVRGKGERSPSGEEPLEQGAFLDWEKDAAPRFPRTLKSPHDLDPDLENSARAMMRALAVEDEWIQGSPFEVLLQDLFTLAVYTDGTPYV